MAQKKFSRLSVLLEARDRMSRPMMDAARSSQRLQNSVRGLNNTMRNSADGARRLASSNGQLYNTFSQVANGSVRASQQTRILANAYRQLGNQIGANTNQMRLSSRMFNMLPRPIRMAAYSIEYYGNSLYRMVAQSALARASTKLLTLAFAPLGNALAYMSLGLDRAKRKLTEFVKGTTTFKYLQMAVIQTKNAVQQLVTSIGRVTGLNRVFRQVADAARQAKEQIKLGAQMSLQWARGIPSIIKTSNAYQGMALAVDKVKGKLREGYLAFNLWKNASPTIEKISNSFSRLNNTLGRPFEKLKQNLANVRTEMSRLQGGRATFNQMAEANSRLNSQVERLNRELNKANNTMGKMKGSMSSLNAIGLAFSGAYAAQAAGNAGKGVVEGTVGRAMEMDYSKQSVGILAGAENAEPYWKQIQSYAATTAYASEDWARNMRAAIKQSKNVDDLKKYQTVIEQLATLDPIQGLDGAALAVRELNSGDITSLVERFELPRSTLKDIKGITDPIKQIEALSKLIGDNTGYSVENIQKMKELPLMQWQKFTNSVKNGFGQIGMGALEVIQGPLKQLNEAFDAGKFQPFIDSMKTMFGGLATDIINIGIAIATAFGDGSLAEKFAPFITLWQNLKATLAEAWPTIQEIANQMIGIFGQIADTINAHWPTINSLLQTMLTLVKDVATWVNENWPAISSVIVGVAVAFGTLKIIEGITFLWRALTVAINLWRAGTLLATVAQWALNSALLANPIGLVIAILAGLVAALVYAYNESETFRNIIDKAWSWIKDVGAACIQAGSDAIDALSDACSAAMDWVGNLWDKFMGFVNDVKNTKIDWSAIMPGGDPFIDFGGKGHHGGLNNVPYDGYQARLHKGERVLTAQENKDYMSGGGGGGVSITGNTFIVRQESDIDAIATQLYRKLSGAQTGMA